MADTAKQVIKLYPLSSLQNTYPGSSWGQEYLARQGVVFCEHACEADIFFTKNFPFHWRHLVRILWRHGLKKPLVVHTHEPRFCTLSAPGPFRRWPFPEIHIMDVYTGDVHLNNYSMYHWAIGQEVPPPSADHLQLRSKSAPVVGLAAYVNAVNKRQLMIGNQDIDLSVRRQQLLLRGHERGLVDIYGRNWPEGMTRGESRGGNWHQEKRQIIKRYAFNVAIENTAWPHYCSEKIWDAIAEGCLPIYWGKGTAIYEDFPRKSFLDYSEYQSPDELLDHVEQMEEAEYFERLTLCIAAYNKVVHRLDPMQERERVLARFAQRVRQIMKISSDI